MEYLQALLNKFEKGIPLNWDEKNVLCAFLVNMTPKNDELLQQYDSILKDYIFEMTYFNFHKPASIEDISDSESRKKLLECNFDVAQYMEKVCDNSILDEYVNMFDQFICPNHANKCNREAFKQFKIEYNLLNSRYEDEVLETKLFSLKLKFIYLLISTIEFYNHYKLINNLNEITVDLNSISVEFDESSFLHIINGHVFNNHRVDTDYQPNKSLFKIGGNLSIMIDSLIKIVNKLNEQNLFYDFTIQTKKLNIYLKFTNNQVFALHINSAKRPIIGTGQSELYQKIGSYYPVENHDKLMDLNANFELIKIDNDIEMYRKKE